jgi:hypothetical protein
VRRSPFGSNQPQVSALGLAPSFLDNRPLFRAGNLRLSKTHGVSPLKWSPIGWRPASSQLPPSNRRAPNLRLGARVSVWDGSTARSVAFQRQSPCLPLPITYPPTRLLVRRPDGTEEALGLVDAHNLALGANIELMIRRALPSDNQKRSPTAAIIGDPPIEPDVILQCLLECVGRSPYDQ